ncbi:hypothetical protein SNE40_008805 [Patella caerulea]|uniref:Uncharacterized protein n=1 Tax=Patella caerulea TaxID=87958 RepID=A0AAN8PP81_PATCE
MLNLIVTNPVLKQFQHCCRELTNVGTGVIMTKLTFKCSFYWDISVAMTFKSALVRPQSSDKSNRVVQIHFIARQTELHYNNIETDVKHPATVKSQRNNSNSTDKLWR